MPECLNCGSHVTDDYVRVFSANGDDSVRTCPDCPDMIRGKGGRPREARSQRRNTEPLNDEQEAETEA